MKDNAKSRYDARTAYKVGLKLNRNTDGDLIAALDAAPNKQALIKSALRQYLSSLSDTTGGTMTANEKGAMTMTAQEIIANGSYDAAVALMDDEIRETVHADLSPCTELEFLEEYMRRHLEKYGEEFTI